MLCFLSYDFLFLPSLLSLPSSSYFTPYLHTLPSSLPSLPPFPSLPFLPFPRFPSCHLFLILSLFLPSLLPPSFPYYPSYLFLPSLTSFISLPFPPFVLPLLLFSPSLFYLPFLSSFPFLISLLFLSSFLSDSYRQFLPLLSLRMYIEPFCSSVVS